MNFVTTSVWFFFYFLTFLFRFSIWKCSFDWYWTRSSSFFCLRMRLKHLIEKILRFSHCDIYTVCKFQDFSATQILCEINFGHFEATNVAIFPFEQLWILNFWEFLTFSSVKFFQNSKFKASKIVETTVFDLLKSAKIDFT